MSPADPVPPPGALARLVADWPPSGPPDPPAHAVRRAVALALAEDVGPLGDLTAMLVPEGTGGRARVVARARGVLAGRRCAAETFAQVDPGLAVDWRLADGAELGPGTVVAEVHGAMRSLLTAERTALNFLCHLSGVATATRLLVDAVGAVNPRTRVLDTRKTTPGLRILEKAAVRAGGGWNHRFDLSEMVLVKDNHLGGLGITEAVTRAKGRWPGLPVEVECERMDQVKEALEAGVTAVLLDNMAPDQVASCVAAVRAHDGRGGVLVEVSGRVTVESAARYAAAGADLVSSGALTHSSPALDFGLDLEPGED